MYKMLSRVLYVSSILHLCSFAGGKSDPSDRDVVVTALREAQEELGVNVATDRVWGVLKPLRDMVSENCSEELRPCGEWVSCFHSKLPSFTTWSKFMK